MIRRRNNSASSLAGHTYETLISDAKDGLEIGSDVQAWSANLDEYAAVNPTTAGLALLDDADNTAQRTTLGLSTMATQAASGVAITGGTIAACRVESVPNTHFSINDTAENHALFIVPNEDLSANRILNVVVGNADRTLTLGGNTTLNGGTHSGTNTGDQTTVSGNAGTATALQNARLINGTSFNGTADIRGVLNEVANTLLANYSMAANSGVVIPAPYTITPGVSLTIPSTSKMVILHYAD